MITITVLRNEKNEICSYKLEGHAGYAEKGYDIVCSAVSAVANLALISFDELDIKPKYEVNDGGFLSIEVPENIEGTSSVKLQFLLECMLKEFIDIKKNYGEYIKIIQKPGN